MNRLLSIRCSLAAASLLVMGLAVNPTAQATADDSACSQQRVETDPAAVIEPCTALLEDPNLPGAQRSTALFVRGQAYHHTKRPELAKADYDAAIKLTPDNDAIYPSRANIAYRLGRFSEASDLLTTALTINPKNAHALRMLGVFRFNGGRFDEAIRYFSVAIAADPNDANALLLRSYSYANTRQYELALKDADTLVAIPPERINRPGYLDIRGKLHDFHIQALVNRVERLTDIGKFELAERDVDAAMAYKRTADSLALRGEFFMNRPGAAEAALADLEAATALDPDHLRAFYNKGTLLAGLKRYGDAFRAFDRAVAIDPGYDYPLRMRALMFRELGQTDMAVADLKNAMLMRQRVAAMTVQSLHRAGYLQSPRIPDAFTPELEDALRACMIDKSCN
jgi:tetratricopeptide (TPR) repeat protein